MAYICEELVDTQSGQVCKKWVVYQAQPNFGLSVTQDEANLIGGFLIVFLSSIVAYLVIVKAIKEA